MFYEGCPPERRWRARLATARVRSEKFRVRASSGSCLRRSRMCRCLRRLNSSQLTTSSLLLSFTMSSKRSRPASPSEGEITSYRDSSTDTSPAKLSRSSDSSAFQPITCVLPPTCAQRPTVHYTARDLESHYNKCHAHVCEIRNCRKVFPDAHFLSLVRAAFHGYHCHC